MQVANFCGFLASWRHFRGVARLRLALAVALLGTLAPQSHGVLATGGTVTNYFQNGTNFTAHSFTDSGSLVIHAGGTVEYLVVAGGGGAGGSYQGGGGGAGGLLAGIASVATQTYAVTVGKGGLGGYQTATNTVPRSGGNSSIQGLVTAVGGGYGGQEGLSAASGGAGGGGAHYAWPSGGAGTTGQGNRGGNRTEGCNGSGGGGAGGQGRDNGNPGGPGRALCIAGASVLYARGGDGQNRPGSGAAITGSNGASNTGNGGNGGGNVPGSSPTGKGGNGGSGIVVIRYVTPTNPPIAHAQSVTTAEDTAAAITLAGTDPNGAALTYMLLTPPAHGTLAGTPPAVIYKPGTNYHGTDRFTFRVYDVAFTSAVACVSLTVTPINDAPTVTAIRAPAIGTAPLTVSFAATGADVDGDTLTYAWQFGDGQSAVGQDVSHAYAATGSYAAVVTVSDSHGGAATASCSIRVVGPADDPDCDGFTVAEEARLGTDPFDAHSHPLLADRQEALAGSWPLYSNLADELGGPTVGTMVGGGVLTNGYLLLNGDGGHLTFGPAPDLQATTPFSWSLWVAPLTTGVEQRVLGRFRSADNQRSHAALLDPSQKLWLFFSEDGSDAEGHTATYVTRDPVTPAAVWSHLAIVWDASQTNAPVVCYTNAVPTPLIAVSAAPVSLVHTSNVDFTLGALDVDPAHPLSASNTFAGGFCRFVFAHAAFSPVEVAELYQLGLHQSLGAWLDQDRDGDALPDWWERLQFGTIQFGPHDDPDADGLPTGWELRYFGNLDQAAADDPDHDGLSNLQEYQLGTNPTLADTDGDGMPDGWEVANGFNPLSAADGTLDADGDGLSNRAEYVNQSNPRLADTDGDGLADGLEVNTYHSNPCYADSDGDGYADALEVMRGTDPAAATSFPASQWQNHLKLIFRDGVITVPLTNLPVLVRLTPERLDYSQCAADGRDIYFTDSTGTPMAFEIEQWNPAGESLVWVRAPALGGAAANYFWLHYGNPAAVSVANPTAVWNANYAGVWHFAETNNTLADSTAGAHPGANVGSVVAAGMLGNARDFRGSDYMDVAPAAFTAISNAVTVSLWVYGADSQPANTVCFYGSSAVGRELNAHITWSDANVYWDAFGNVDRISKTANPNLYKGGWNHWTFTKDCRTGVMAVYCNGELWHSGTGKTRPCNPITAFRIGMDTGGWCGYLGRMDEIRVETVAQSAAWIRFQYQTMRDQVLIYGDQVVALAASVNGTEAGPTNALFTITRTGLNTSLPLSVALNTPAGSATEGVDYTTLPRTVILPAGDLVTTLCVPVNDDFWVEPTEAVIVSLAAGNYRSASASATATVIIADNDTNGDSSGMSATFQMTYFGSLGVSTNADPDADGLTNLREFQLGTNPTCADTDGDGLPDGWEVANGLNPCVHDAALDADNDGLANLPEYLRGANPRKSDSDGDALSDGEEVNTFGLNPATADSNQNGIPDAFAKTTRRGREAATQIVTHNTLTFTPSGDFLIWPNSAACSLFYDLQSDTPGLHLLEVSAANWAAVTIPNYSFEFAVYANGVAVGTIAIPARANYGVATNHFMLPWFEPGTYRVQLVWLNRYVVDGLVDRPAIQRVRLLAIDNATDANQDGIADWMPPVLQASTADTDRDGLLDRDEVLIHRSNPLLADSDNDGLADAYEALTSHTALNNADTDGDGVGDAIEVNIIGTNPLAADLAGGWQTVASRTGNEYVATNGDWRCLATPTVTAYGRGSIEYDVTLPTDDLYLARVTAAHAWSALSCDATIPQVSGDCLVYVDGQFVGASRLRAPMGATDQLYVALPHLKAGAHRVRIVWNVSEAHLCLRIHQVEIGTYPGPDANADGVKDWVTARARLANRLDAMPASVISPACVEGSAQYPLLSSGSAGTNALAIQPGVAGRWYANLPLDPSGMPTPYTVRFEHGACATSAAVAWIPLDLLAVTNQTLRVGDTLMFTVQQPAGFSNGVATVALDDAAPVMFTPGQIFTQYFAAATSHVLHATWTGEAGQLLTSAVTIAVCAAPLPVADPACMLGRARAWNCPGTTPGVVFEGDPGMTLSWNGASLSLLVNRMYAEHFVIARAGANGPILASRRVKPFWIQAAVDSYVKVIEKRATSQVWQQRMLSLGISDDVTVELSIFVGGVTFDDLSIVRYLTSAQLGDPGNYKFNLIHPNSVAASVCHTIRAYQNGVYLGEAYYALIGLPEDLR